jgi:hypothetical protein
MAKNLCIGFPKYVELENTAVLRKHLERHTYMSGSGTEGGYKERRGYYGGRRQSST